VQVEDQLEESSRHGLSKLGASWRLIELWKLNGEDLLAANDVGLIPWVPLTQISGPPERILRQCRERIDRQAKPSEHAALLTVTTLLTSVVYDDEALLAIFGGSRTMIESPLLNRILAQTARQNTQANILHILKGRFRAVPEDIAEKLRTVEEESRLEDLLDFCVNCPDLESFRVRLVATA
jgi:hypothetical protein